MVSRRTSAQRRHQRNMDRAAVERAREHIFTKCWICDSEFVVNNYTDNKVRTKSHELGEHLICSNCRTVINGRVVPRAGLDWAKEFVQMHKLLGQVAMTRCTGISAQGCKCESCAARRLVKKMERAPRRLYRRRRVEPQEV